MAVKGKLPKLQRELKAADRFGKYVPSEIQQLKFFTPKGFKKQIKAGISREVSASKKDLVPREIKDLRKLKLKTLIKAALGPSLKQRAAMGVSAVIAEEAPILFLLLSKKRKKTNNTKQLLDQTRTEVILIRRIQEGSISSKKQVTDIVKRQMAQFKREQEGEEKQEKPDVEKVTKQKTLARSIAGVSVAGMIALYGPAVWPVVKGFLGEVIPGIISQGLMGLAKPVQSFFEVFTSGKAKETFENVIQSFGDAQSELSSFLNKINPIKNDAAKLEAQLPKQPSELKSVQQDAELGSILEMRKELAAADIDDEPVKKELKEPKPKAEKEREAPAPTAPKTLAPPQAPTAETKPAPASTPAPGPSPAPVSIPAPTVETKPAQAPAPETKPTPTPVAKPSVQAAPTKPAPSATQQPVKTENLATVASIQSGVELQGLNPTLEQRVAAMAADFKAKTDKKLLITSGVRSNEKQKQLWDAEMARTGGNAAAARKKVAEPMPPLGAGKGSAHLKGIAIDISSLGASGVNILAGSRDNSTGWLESFGLVRNVPGEDWHIQLANTPPLADNPTNPGTPLAVPDKNGAGTNVTSGEQIAGMSAEANRLRNQPVIKNKTVVVKTTQTQGLVS